MMAYATPTALEMAVKAAAKASSLDTGRAVSGIYFHRFLCRIFSRQDSPFVLKGGQSMLARTADARATRDIDLLSEKADIDEALAELKHLAAIDLEDFVTFEFVGYKPIKAEDDYRAGLNVTFTPLLGGKRLQDISIDLVFGQIAYGKSEVVEPADRIDVPDIPTFGYRIYPATCSLADKLCAMVEMHGGRPSSRIKDLVDVAVYAVTTDFDGGELCRRARIEATVRGIKLPEKYAAPMEWKRLYRGTFRKLVRQTGLPPEYAEIETAEALAASLLDPVLSQEADGRRWYHENLGWE